MDVGLTNTEMKFLLLVQEDDVQEQKVKMFMLEQKYLNDRWPWRNAGIF